MWFAFGFVTLTGLVLLSAYKRLDTRWAGAHGQVGSAQYEYRIDSTGLRDLNMEWDRQPRQSFEVAVLGKRTSRSRRSGTRHYIRVEDWATRGDEREIRVPAAAFHRLPDKARITVYVKPGRLGFRWVPALGGPNGWVVR